MTQQAPKTVGVPQMVGLFVFVATAAIFLASLANTVIGGLHDVQQFSMAFSSLVAAIAIGVMFVDVYDLWVRGRRFSRQATRSFRMIAFVALLASMATALLGGNLTLVMLLLPSILIYYMTMRPQPSATRGARPGRRPATTSSGPTRSRQRRGGKKRR